MYKLLKFVYFYSLIYYKSTTDLFLPQFTTELNADPGGLFWTVTPLQASILWTGTRVCVCIQRGATWRNMRPPAPIPPTPLGHKIQPPSSKSSFLCESHVRSTWAAMAMAAIVCFEGCGQREGGVVWTLQPLKDTATDPVLIIKGSRITLRDHLLPVTDRC